MTRLAIGYARVSTEDQAQGGHSLEAQRAQLAAYCTAHGYDLVGIEVEDQSGKRADNRPGLQEALRQVCLKKGVLVVTKLDRLARNTVDAIAIAARLKKQGADLAILDLHVDTNTAMGEFIFTIFAALGQLERKMIADRTRSVLSHKRQKGERISGHPPYGWRFLDGCLIEVVGEQAVLSTIEGYRALGYSLRKIADQLNRDGVKAKLGGPWSHSSIQSVLVRAEKVRDSACV